MTDKITNFYETMPKKYLKKYVNPAYDKHLLKVPYRLLVIGSSGSGKTLSVIEIIKRMDKTFNMIVLCVKDVDEPLYQYLISKLPSEQVHIVECADGSTQNIPKVQEFQQFNGQILIIFDDLVLERQQHVIEEYFVRGRKMGGGITSIYLTQSYYRTPKVIRLNCNYLIIKKLASERDLNMIFNECSLGVDKKTLMNLYKDATSEKTSFLLVDLDAPSNKRFRKNFLGVYELDN